MEILTHLKCRTCGAHAPIRRDEKTLGCMTCNVKGPMSDFAPIPGVEPAPQPQHVMQQSEFADFVAQRWDRNLATDAADEMSSWIEIGEQTRTRILAFARDLINDLPN